MQVSLRAKLIQFHFDINKTTCDACLAGEWLCSRDIHHRLHNTRDSNGIQLGFYAPYILPAKHVWNISSPTE